MQGSMIGHPNLQNPTDKEGWISSTITFYNSRRISQHYLQPVDPIKSIKVLSNEAQNNF
jgi:hypothetical protein